MNFRSFRTNLVPAVYSGLAKTLDAGALDTIVDMFTKLLAAADQAARL